MFLLLNVVRSLFVSRMAARTQKPLKGLGEAAERTHAALVRLGEPKTPMGVIEFLRLKADADRADEAYLAAAERADRWGGRKQRPSRFVPSYLSGKLDAITAAAVVYPFVPQVAAWVKSLV